MQRSADVCGHPQAADLHVAVQQQRRVLPRAVEQVRNVAFEQHLLLARVAAPASAPRTRRWEGPLQRAQNSCVCQQSAR